MHPDILTALPSRSAIETLKPQIVLAAQNQYDAWSQNENGYNEEVGFGGICHLIADDVASILAEAGFPCSTETATDVQHVYCVLQAREGVFQVDIPYHIYERGSMFTWTKIPGITFKVTDVVVDLLDSDPSRITDYVEYWPEE